MMSTSGSAITTSLPTFSAPGCSGPNLICLPALHVRASTWLEEEGIIPEAIHHLLAAQEKAKAADLIERYGPDALPRATPRWC